MPCELFKKRHAAKIEHIKVVMTERAVFIILQQRPFPFVVSLSNHERAKGHQLFPLNPSTGSQSERVGIR